MLIGGAVRIEGEPSDFETARLLHPQVKERAQERTKKLVGGGGRGTRRPRSGSRRAVDQRIGRGTEGGQSNTTRKMSRRQRHDSGPGPMFPTGASPPGSFPCASRRGEEAFGNATRPGAFLDNTRSDVASFLFCLL